MELLADRLRYFRPLSIVRLYVGQIIFNKGPGGQHCSEGDWMNAHKHTSVTLPVLAAFRCLKPVL